MLLYFLSVHPIQSDTDILGLQPIPVCSIYRKAQGHVSDLIVQDTEAQSRLAFLQLDHLSLSLPHGQRRRHGGHATLGDVLSRRAGNDTALVQLGRAERREREDTGKETDLQEESMMSVAFILSKCRGCGLYCFKGID